MLSPSEFAALVYEFIQSILLLYVRIHISIWLAWIPRFLASPLQRVIFFLLSLMARLLLLFNQFSRAFMNFVSNFELP